MTEWWGTRLILEYYLGEATPNPDDSSGFKELRAKKVSGLTLAYLSLSQQNWEHCKLLQIVGRPCWGWFTEYHQNVKTAQDAVKYSIHMSNDWKESEHLRQMAALCAPGGKSQLDSVMYWARDAQGLSATAVSYCIELLGQRCGSLSKHGLPPQVYAGLLSEDHEASIAALKKMKLDFKLLQGMEVSSAPLATSLAADLRLSVSAPIRLVMNAFEVCNFRLCPQAEGAVEILRVLVQKLPDTKCIEDLHQRIRSKQNSRSNDKLSLGCLQNIVIFSNIIEQRKLKHPAALSKQVFRQQYRSTKARNYNEKKMMRAKGHKLPKRFSRLMDPKIAWQSVTESNLVRSAAAWSWARKYHKRRLKQDGFEIQAWLVLIVLVSPITKTMTIPFCSHQLQPMQAGRLNFLCEPGMLIQNQDANFEDEVWVVLKEHMWATMVWPLKRLDTARFELDPAGKATWLHVYNLDDFAALPSVANWEPTYFGLHIVQVDDPMPLAKYALVSKPSALVYNSLLVLAQYLQLCTTAQKPSRKSLLQSLAESLSGGDANYVQAVLHADEKKKQQSGNDDGSSHLVNCLFENLDLEERTEYRDLKKKTDQSAKLQKQQKWQRWLKEKTDETQAGL